MSKWILFFILLLYAALGFYQLHLPGLHYDEAFEAVPALQLWQGQPVDLFRGSGLRLGGQLFPLMTQDYIGAVNTYLALPFIALLGPTPQSLRMMTLLGGGITLWLVYLLASRLTGQAWAGLLAALLLAVDPTFIFWSRQGVFVTSVTAPIGLAASYCWLSRLKHPWGMEFIPHGVRLKSVFPTWKWSLSGAFLFGLGIYAKFLFVWLIMAFLGSIVLLNFGELKGHGFRLVRHITPVEVILAGLAFLLGCAPLIIYNLQTGGTWVSISQNALTSYYGVNNLAFGSNLLERLSQLIIFLSDGHLWYLGEVANNFWEPILLGGVVGGVVIITTRKNLSPEKKTSSLQGQESQNFPDLLSPAKTALFPVLMIGLVTLASIATVSALWITHFAILMPWPALTLAVGSWYILGCLDPSPSGWGAFTPLSLTVTEASTPPSLVGKGVGGLGLSHWLKASLWAGLGLLLALDLANSVRYHLALAKSGGLSSHSDAIYDLSDWLDRRAQGPVVAMDWGLAAPITFLTGGRVMPTEIFGYGWQSDVQLTEWLESYVARPNTLYLWRAPDEIIFDRSSDFKALYRPKDLEETIEEAFYERSGRPLLGVTRLVQKGTAANPPK
jgi:hypothetical protein